MELIELLEHLAVLNRDNGEAFTCTDRLDRIASLLQRTAYRHIPADGLFRLYGKRMPQEVSGPVTVISSHADCHMDITRCFSRAEDEEHLRGTYDNLVTNAVALSLMLAGRLPENVFFALTGDEEDDMTGAIELARYLRRERIPAHIIVLDVTDMGWADGADFTIENNFWTEVMGQSAIYCAQASGSLWRFVPQNLEKLPAYVPRACVIPAEAWCDEAWEYDEAGIPCFSLCIPCQGEMHSDEGVLIRRKALARYAEVLERMALALS